MNPINQTTEKASPIRPKYIHLGTDQEGAHHVYRSVDESIFEIRDGEIENRYSIDGRSVVDDYVGWVQGTRGWDDRQYGFGPLEELAMNLADQFAGTLNGDG
jgi:hypothetical protein